MCGRNRSRICCAIGYLFHAAMAHTTPNPRNRYFPNDFLKFAIKSSNKAIRGWRHYSHPGTAFGIGLLVLL
jgi:hypothetical protein